MSPHHENVFFCAFIARIVWSIDSLRLQIKSVYLQIQFKPFECYNGKKHFNPGKTYEHTIQYSFIFRNTCVS